MNCRGRIALVSTRNSFPSMLRFKCLVCKSNFFLVLFFAICERTILHSERILSENKKEEENKRKKNKKVNQIKEKQHSQSREGSERILRKPEVCCELELK